ncbi:hypothetical protein GCM10023167_23490 [Brevibacterium pityocampae]|uniref:Uncharacterized protein n=1 Tax=Brevibacterium pityocampae TaxID=506594 RepID=A0ABP8JP68_9MICO
MGQAKPAAPTDDTQALRAEEVAQLRAADAAPEGESTRVLSLEELQQIAAETHDDRLDGPRERPEAHDGPRATAAHLAWAERQAPPSRWPGRDPAPVAAPTVGGAPVPPPPPVPPMVGGGAGASQPPHGAQHYGAGRPAQRKRGMPGAAIAVIVIAVLLVLGIIGYILFDMFSGQDRGDDAAMPAPPPPAGAPESPGEEDSEAPSTPASEVRSFAAPSGNISCTIDAERARCTIASFDYEPPEKPADCEIDNWGGIVVANDDGAGFSCAPAPEAPEAEPLDYGESIEAHGMTCTSARDGMSCTSDATGKGFTVARAGADFVN